MSTRGLWGYVVNGSLKTTYNHSDSYPEGLGEVILKHARWCAANLDMARKMAADLRVVDEDAPPTIADVDHLAPWTDLYVSTRTTSDWYCLTRRAQGDPEATLACGVMLDSDKFAADSLFCEWGYVIDLDGERFEVYRGFQHAPHSDGRFASMEPRVHPEYWPIRLVASFPLSDLPEDLSAATE